MATKSPLTVFAPAESPEEEARLEEIRSAREALRKSLDARQAPMFDPVLLAMAQGFLTPTKSGSFGEALGNVAALVGPAQAAEEKRAQEVAMMKAELAQQELAQMQATRGYQDFQRMMGGRPGAQAAPSATPAATPGATPAAAPGAPTPGAPAAPELAGARPISSQDIALMKSNPNPQIARYGEILEDMVKLNRGRYLMSQNGTVFDTEAGQYLNIKIPGQTASDFPTPYGTFKMTPYQYSEFEAAQGEGKGREWLERFTGRKFAEAPTGMRTSTESAAAQAAATTRATEETKAEVGRTQQAIESGADVTGRMAQYASLRAIAARPDASQIFGIFNRPGVANAFLKLAQEGVKSPGTTSIQATALEDALRDVGLPQDQIDRYRFALGTMANIQLQMAKLAQGQGAVSNFERELFASASISPRDNPQTILAKLSMLEERAKFDRAIFSALRKSKMSADDFKDSEEYQRLADGYLSRVAGIAANFGAARPAARPATGAPATDAGRRLREELGIR